MARHYVKKPDPVTPVSDGQLEQARARAAAAAAQLAEAEGKDPGTPGWENLYTAASAAARAANRKVEAVERQLAEQVERSGKRAAAVKSMAADLTSMAGQLAASRDALGAVAAEHLAALVRLELAAATTTRW